MPGRKYVRSKPHNKVTDTTIRLLRQLRAEGVSVAEIAQTLNLSRWHVYRLIRKYCS